MSSILKVDTIQTAAGGTPTAADLGLNVSGSTLQIVRTSASTDFTFAGTTWATWGTLNITPASTSSKLLVLFSGSGFHRGQASSFDEARVRLLRGGTEVKQNQVGTVGNTSDFEYPVNYSFSHLDTPSTTSQITYTVQLNTQRSDRAGRLMSGTDSQELIIIEIAG